MLRFQSLCSAETAADFEARLYRKGFSGPSKVLQKVGNLTGRRLVKALVLQCPVAPVWQLAEGSLLRDRYGGLELYTATYLGALLNTAYDDYLYCVPLNECVVTISFWTVPA